MFYLYIVHMYHKMGKQHLNLRILLCSLSIALFQHLSKHTVAYMNDGDGSMHIS